jgi:hypothetical protein
MDITKKEDVDTKMEDHIYDEACHIAMARPLSPHQKRPRKSETDRRIDSLEKRSDTGGFVEEAERELALAEQSLERHIEVEELGSDPFDYENEEDYFDTI